MGDEWAGTFTAPEERMSTSKLICTACSATMRGTAEQVDALHACPACGAGRGSIRLMLPNGNQISLSGDASPPMTRAQPMEVASAVAQQPMPVMPQPMPVPGYAPPVQPMPQQQYAPQPPMPRHAPGFIPPAPRRAPYGAPRYGAPVNYPPQGYVAPGYPPQAGYAPQGGYPVQGYAPQVGEMPVPRSNPMAITGFVLGLIGLCLFWYMPLAIILGVLGIVFGALGIVKAKHIGGRQKTLAIWGLSLGIGAIVLSILFIVVIVALIFNAAEHERSGPQYRYQKPGRYEESF
jgi:hypothetical protein